MSRKATGFWAYSTRDGKPTECIVTHRWDDIPPDSEQWRSLKQKHEDFLVRHKIIYPSNSCALSCMLTALNKEHYT